MEIIVVAFAFTFMFGLYVGVWIVYHSYLKQSIEKGILEVGKDTYRISKFVPRNTRI